MPVMQMCGKMTRGALAGPTHTVKARVHCGCETTPSNSHPDSPGDGRDSSEVEVRSSGSRSCVSTATDRRRSDVQMNTNSHLQEHNCS